MLEQINLKDKAEEPVVGALWEKTLSTTLLPLKSTVFGLFPRCALLMAFRWLASDLFGQIHFGLDMQEVTFCFRVAAKNRYTIFLSDLGIQQNLSRKSKTNGQQIRMKCLLSDFKCLQILWGRKWRKFLRRPHARVQGRPKTLGRKSILGAKILGASK